MNYHTFTYNLSSTHTAQNSIMSFTKIPKTSRDATVSLHLAETIAGNDDLLIEILLRLPIKALIKFKSVSKHWLFLISDPKFSRHRNPNPVSASGLFLKRPFWQEFEFEFEFVNLNRTPPEVPLGLSIWPTTCRLESESFTPAMAYCCVHLKLQSQQSVTYTIPQPIIIGLSLRFRRLKTALSGLFSASVWLLILRNLLIIMSFAFGLAT